MLDIDDSVFTRTRRYLKPLILQAAERIDPSRRTIFIATMTDQVGIAAARFLANPTNRRGSYKFSTYFTWYISEQLNRLADD